MSVSFLLHPLAPLITYSVFLTVCWMAYLAYDVAPSPAVEYALSDIWILLTLFWITADARRRDRLPCFDFGFLCLIYYPVSLPWYCIWSRGWRGLLTLVLLASLWVLPAILTALVGAAFQSAG